MIKQNKIILNLMIQKLLRRMTSFLDQNQCWNQGEIHCLWSCVFCAKSADRHSTVQCVLNSERLTDKTDHWLPLGMLPKLKLHSECNFGWLWRGRGPRMTCWLFTKYLSAQIYLKGTLAQSWYLLSKKSAAHLDSPLP